MKVKNVKLFSIESNLSSFPSYAICAASRLNDGEIHGESFLIAIFKGKKAKLIPMEILFRSAIDNKKLPIIDEAFVLEECLIQAKLNMIEVSKNKASMHDCCSLPFLRSVIEVNVDYLFHGLFTDEAIRNKIQVISTISQIEELKKFVETLTQHERVLFTPMQL